MRFTTVCAGLLGLILTDPGFAFAQGRERAPQVPVDFSGPVIEVSADGKTLTFETAPANRSEAAKRRDIHLTDKTEVLYRSVGPDAAKPAAGYQAQVWLQAGSTDSASKIVLAAVDKSKQSRSFATGIVAAVSPDGKKFSLDRPQRGGGFDRTEISLNDQTAISYAFAAQNAEKPTDGYHAEVWFQEGAPGVVTKVRFIDAAREKELLQSGKVIGISAAGGVLALEISPKNRGDAPTKSEIKISPTAEIVYHGVGPNEAKPTEGYTVQFWLQTGSNDTAEKIVFSKGGGGR